MKRILIVAMLALAVTSSALAATGTGKPGRDDAARAKSSSKIEHKAKARHARRSHRATEAEHLRRHDDGLARANRSSISSREAEPGDDRGQAAEPGDDNGGAGQAEPGDDNGGSGSRGNGGGDDGSGHH